MYTPWKDADTIVVKYSLSAGGCLDRCGLYDVSDKSSILYSRGREMEREEEENKALMPTLGGYWWYMRYR